MNEKFSNGIAMAAIYKRMIKRYDKSTFTYKKPSYPPSSESYSKDDNFPEHDLKKANTAGDIPEEDLNDQNIFSQFAKMDPSLNESLQLSNDGHSTSITCTSRKVCLSGQQEFETSSSTSRKPLVGTFSVISSELEDEKDEGNTAPNYLAYTVVAVVDERGLISCVQVSVDILSDFPCYKELMRDKPTLKIAEDLKPPPIVEFSGDDIIDDDSDRDIEEPISCRLRQRSKQKTGGLFPSNSDMIYNWQSDDDVTSDDDETANTSVIAMTKQPLDHDNDNSGMYDSGKDQGRTNEENSEFGRKNLLETRGDAKDSDNDSMANALGQDAFSKVGSSGLKLVLKRQKFSETQDNEPKPGDNDNIPSLTERVQIMARSRITGSSITSSIKCIVPKASLLDLTRENARKLPRIHVSKRFHVQNDAKTELFEACDVQRYTTAPSDGSDQPQERDKELAIDALEKQPTCDSQDKDLTIFEVTEPLQGARTSNDDEDTSSLHDDVTDQSDRPLDATKKEKSKEKARKKKDKNKEKQTNAKGGTADEKETEFRLDMEFPRHNWLVKHLMKEQKLKGNDENVFMANLKRDSHGRNELGKQSPTTVHDDAEPNVNQPSPTSSPAASEPTTQSSITTVLHSTYPITEGQHNMIGIVKPFQYFKEKSPERSSSNDGMCCRSIASSLTFSDDTCKPTKAKNDPCKLTTSVKRHNDASLGLSDVKIEKCFSLASQMESGNNQPLDLTSKGAVAEEDFALDLTKKETTKTPPSVGFSYNSKQKPTPQMEIIGNVDTSPLTASTVSRSVITTSPRYIQNEFEQNNIPDSPLASSIPPALETVRSSDAGITSQPESACARSRISSRDYEKKLNKPGEKCDGRKLYELVRRRESLHAAEIPLSDNRNTEPILHAHPPLSSYSPVISTKSAFRSVASPPSGIPNLAAKTNSVKSEPSLNSSSLLRSPRKTDCDVINVDALDDKLPVIQPRVHQKYSTVNKDSASRNVTVRRLSQPDMMSFPLTTRPMPRQRMMEEDRRGSHQMHLGFPKMNPHLGSTHQIPRPVAHQLKSYPRDLFHTKPPSSTPALTMTLEHRKSNLPQQAAINGMSRCAPPSLTPGLNHNVRESSQYHNGMTSSRTRLSTHNMYLSNGQHVYKNAIPGNMAAPRRPMQVWVPGDRPGFRVPIKPTPVRTQRLVNPNGTCPQADPISAYPNASYGPSRANTSNSIPQNHMQSHMHESRSNLYSSRQVMPKPTVVRAPPGGVSINSTPIKVPEYSINNRSQAKYTTTGRTITHGNHTMHGRPITPPSLKMLSPGQAEIFAAQLKSQKAELENKIHGLKVLEKKIHIVPSYVHNTHQHSPNTLMQHDVRKRKSFDAHSVLLAPPDDRKVLYLEARQPPNKVRKTGPVPPSSGQSTDAQNDSEEKCIVCKQRAFFVCSGCRSVWYCSKYCQFEDWGTHNKTCL